MNEEQQKRMEQLKYEGEQRATAGLYAKVMDCGSSAGQIGGYALNEPCRPSLRERVSGDVERARRESRKYEQLLELQHLLEKNPEVARILDLLELVRG